MKKFDKEHELLIVPDVHGRTFWQEPVLQGDYAHVIFLGDYCDPYPQEGIYPDEAVEIFQKVVDFASSHADSTTLLLGNHDMHYVSKVFNDHACGSRYSWSMEEPICEIYNAHKELFTLAMEAEYEGIRVLFTHAGVSPVWAHENKDLLGEVSADNLNALGTTEQGVKALGDVGWMRGGWAKAGGPLWADYDEVAITEHLEGIYQIFGHTQNYERTPRITRYVACLDCHRTFRLGDVLRQGGVI